VPKVSRERAAVLTALLLVQVFFGFHYLAAKQVMAEMPPLVYASLRAAGGAALLLGLAIALRRPFPNRGDAGRLAAWAVLGVVINQIFFVEGLYRTSTIHSALLNSAIPVMTLLVAVALGRERMDGLKAASVGLAVGGVLLILKPGTAALATRTLTGDVLTLVNGTSYALFLVLAKRVLGRTDALAATAVLLTFGALLICLVGLPAWRSFDAGAVSAAGWAWLAFVVVFPTAGAYLLNNWALARADASVVALFIYLQPVIAAVLGMVRLHERPAPATWVGGALVLSAVSLALRPRSRAPGDTVRA
jgi:drug/metabolite transporter (DMT)-like permease